MGRLRSCRGVALIEVLVTTIIVAGVAVTLSLFYPRASKSYIHNRGRMVARELAFSLLDDIQKRPYDAIPLTDPTVKPAPFAIATVCDCMNGLSLAGVPPVAVFPEAGATLSKTTPVGDEVYRDGTKYVRQVCINLVGIPPKANDLWPNFCPTDPDHGLKNVRVRVSWHTPDGLEQSFILESVVTQG